MITILLAAYNSEKYLREQIDSLLAQDCQDFQILIRDGGSVDHTLEIIQEYLDKKPGKIKFLGSGKASAVQNFSALLQACDTELVMFCDHDDFWFPHKISHTLAKYREAEKKYGAQTPIMVFTDSCVTDRHLKIIDSSLIRYQHLNPFRLTLNRLIVQNVPNGNAMMINRALINLACPIPPEAIMSDHWISLVAAAFGKIVFLNESTLHYRQHGDNIYGAFKYSLAGILKKYKTGKDTIRNRFEQNIRQAAAFRERYLPQLSGSDRKMLDALAGWPEYGFWKRRTVILKHRILKSGAWRNIGLFLVI